MTIIKRIEDVLELAPKMFELLFESDKFKDERKCWNCWRNFKRLEIEQAIITKEWVVFTSNCPKCKYIELISLGVNIDEEDAMRQIDTVEKLLSE